MERKTYIIHNKLGFHARAAASFVKIANQFPCEVRVIKDGMAVNGKSIMGLLTLAASLNSKIILHVEGEASREALESLGALIANKFGEEE